MIARIYSILTLLLVSAGIGYAAPKFQVTFKVVDDFGKPVESVTVGVSVYVTTKPGDAFGTDIFNNLSRQTDKNGTAIVEGTGIHPFVSYGLRPLNGYYAEEGGADCWFKEVQNDSWQPWNPTINLVLKPILNPVPMYSGGIDDKKIPAQNKPVGFDLIKNDWVAPYGKGEISDMVFLYESAPERWITNWYGADPRPRPLRDEKLTISFTNNGDGIQCFLVPKNNRSALRIRQAPTDGYEPVLVKHDYDEITGTDRRNTMVKVHSNSQADANYVLRVRTKKDGQGNIVSALYGVIYNEFNAVHGGGVGRVLSFRYHLNPEPNSRNLEFDRQRDFKGKK